MMGTLHLIKVLVVEYKYEKRITAIVFQIVECCGKIQGGEKVCADCKLKIAKCSRLVKRGQIPFTAYIVMVNHIING